MGYTSVGRHGIHIYPFETAEMILDTQSFFKQAAKFDRTQVDIPEPMIYLFTVGVVGLVWTLPNAVILYIQRRKFMEHAKEMPGL